MKCSECRGACCESVLLPFPAYDSGGSAGIADADANRWLALHGSLTEIGGRRLLELECRCSALTAEGRCGIYAERPLTCQLYEAGGPGCMRTVRDRRTPEQYARIRDDRDPERIHDREQPSATGAVGSQTDMPE